MRTSVAGIAQLVEQLTCNQKVPSSTLGAGTNRNPQLLNGYKTVAQQHPAGIAQLVEQLTCNQKVPSSTLGAGTKFKAPIARLGLFSSAYCALCLIHPE